MKKVSLLATLLFTMAGTAAAQNVEVYGKMRIYQERTETGTATAVSRQTQDGSRLGFRGTEDLGSGLKAFFTLETSVGADAPAATSLGDRISLVGLSSSMGRIGLGRDKHQVIRVLDAYDPLETAFGTTTSIIHQTHGTRVQNAVFVSASPVKNLSVHYQNAASEVSGQKNAQAFGIDGKIGAVSASVAQYTNGLKGATKDESTIYGAKFAIDATKTTLFGIYSQDTVDGAETTGKTFGVQQKLSDPITLMVSYGENADIKAYAVGASYAMSKRTMLHVRYRDVNADAAASDLTQFGIGIEHNF